MPYSAPCLGHTKESGPDGRKIKGFPMKKIWTWVASAITFAGIGLALAQAAPGCNEPHCNHPELTPAQKQACEDRLKHVQRNIVPSDAGVEFLEALPVAMPPPSAYAACGEVWDAFGIMNSQVALGMSKVWRATPNQATPLMVSVPNFGGGLGHAVSPNWRAPHDSVSYNLCADPNLLQPRFKQSSIDIEYDIGHWPDPWNTIGGWSTEHGDLLPSGTFQSWKVGAYELSQFLNVPGACLMYVHNLTMFTERGRAWDGQNWHEYWTSNRASYWNSRGMVPEVPNRGWRYDLALEAVDPYIFGVIGRTDDPNEIRLVYGMIEMPDGNGGVFETDVELDCYSRMEWRNIYQQLRNLEGGCRPGFCGN